jgi:hypothetical protein
MAAITTKIIEVVLEDFKTLNATSTKLINIRNKEILTIEEIVFVKLNRLNVIMKLIRSVFVIRIPNTKVVFFSFESVRAKTITNAGM